MRQFFDENCVKAPLQKVFGCLEADKSTTDDNGGFFTAGKGGKYAVDIRYGKNGVDIAQVDTGARHPRGIPGKVLFGVPVAWSLFQLWYASPLPFLFGIGVFNNTEARSIHLAFAVFLAFTAFPAFKRSPRDYIPIQDWIFAALGAFSAAYIYLFYAELSARSGAPTTTDLIVAVIGMVLLLEATRRALGPPLMIVAIVLLAYTFGGPYMPDVIAHKGQSLHKVMSHQWLTTEGVFGIALGVSTSFVFLFVLFGALLEQAGAGNYFIKVAFALLGHMRGGPAKAAIVASATTGLISGSSIANVATTGTFTIPLMKRVGFPGTKAGAVEVAARYGVNIDMLRRLSGRFPLVHRGAGEDSLRACVAFSLRGRVEDRESLRNDLLAITREDEVDLSFQEDNLYRRHRRLIVFDMDSTLIQCEVIDELAAVAGVGGGVGSGDRDVVAVVRLSRGETRAVRRRQREGGGCGRLVGVLGDAHGASDEPGATAAARRRRRSRVPHPAHRPQNEPRNPAAPPGAADGRADGRAHRGGPERIDRADFGQLRDHVDPDRGQRRQQPRRQLHVRSGFGLPGPGRRDGRRGCP